MAVEHFSFLFKVGQVFKNWRLPEAQSVLLLPWQNSHLFLLIGVDNISAFVILELSRSIDGILGVVIASVSISSIVIASVIEF